MTTTADLATTLLADGWTRDEDGDLVRDDSTVLIHSDGTSVAVSHRGIWPSARVVPAAVALAWTRGEVDSLDAYPAVRVA